MTRRSIRTEHKSESIRINGERNIFKWVPPYLASGLHAANRDLILARSGLRISYGRAFAWSGRD
jgi:hypothetical protein